MPRTKHEKVAAELRAAIDRGDYSPGDRLPSENELHDTHGVARMTARNAVMSLVHAGIAHRVWGVGTFVGPAEDVVEIATEYPRALWTQIVDAASQEGVEPRAWLVQAARDRVEPPDPPRDLTAEAHVDAP